MLRLFSFFLLLFLNTSFLSAQDIKWSDQLVESRKTPYLQILGEDENENIFVLRSNFSMDKGRKQSGHKSRVYSLQYFSPELRLIWDKEFLTSFENGFITDVKMINGRVMVASYNVDKKKKLVYFYDQYIDNHGKWTGQPFLLDSVSSEILDDDDRPGFIYSKDQSLIAFSLRTINKDNKSQSFQVVVVDTNISLKYKKVIEVPFSTQDFEPLDFILTNQGSFFIIGIHYSSDKRVKGPDQNYYELFGYNALLDRTVNTTIRSENKYLTDVGITTDNINKSIVVAGFYSDKSSYSSAGVFYYSLTEDSLKETKTINTPFGVAYLQKFLGDKKESRELVNYTIDRLIVRRDGGVALTAESMYETNRSYYDYYMQSFISHTYYHYGNIMVLSVNPDGNILWNNVITKDQNSADDGGYLSSYFSAVTGGRLVVLYNKYIEEESSVLISTVDATGLQKTDVLFNELEKVYIIPKSGRQINDETFLIPAYKKNKLHIIRISF